MTGGWASRERWTGIERWGAVRDLQGGGADGGGVLKGAVMEERSDSARSDYQPKRRWCLDAQQEVRELLFRIGGRIRATFALQQPQQDMKVSLNSNPAQQ